ncbi:FAD-dependent oxidoreductase [Nocardia pseudobrasiliensis]|uniref:FAD-dependent oxidoreductase n=1 Tax=Nocardia pseudobrasiliensis TaxID=45979 RepID=UPI00082F0EAD|nr:FAD-dependent oxidoreductase [Nocardia pseudobrasiliensis]
MTSVTAPDFEILVIGAGQAGLSVAYHLRRLGLRPAQDFLVVDHAPAAGGAWQFRWPSLTLSTVNGVHDLPGMTFAETLPEGSADVPAATAVPHYFELYEKRFELRVRRPVSVRVVCDRATVSTCPQAEVDGLLHAETIAEETETSTAATDSDRSPDDDIRVRGIINATGTWDKPFIPYYPGAETFAGRQLHAHDYRSADEFAGRHVVVVGAGITAVQLLDEISRVTTTTWVSRTEPRWRDGPFTPDVGRRAVAMVEDRVRRGLPPRSVVSVTGLAVDERVRAARARGALDWHPMFQRIEPDGVRFADGTLQPAQIILWATGFRSALDHLAPLRLRSPGGGITMTGRLATQVAADPRIHLIGYGPSASTIGANRAGRAAAVELTEYLGLS